MLQILDTLDDLPVRSFEEGEFVLHQGETTGLLFFLIEGAVEVVKDQVMLARVDEPGAIFGDLSALLNIPHTAAVRATKPTRFYVATNPREFLETHPKANVHLCELLARRLDAMNKYLVDVREQFAGHDHIGMVDRMLDTLMYRQPRNRVIPKSSTIRDPEISD